VSTPERLPDGAAIPIRAVRRVAGMDERWCGIARLPGKPAEQHVLIFRRGRRYFAVSAHCPHEGYRLDQCPVNGQGEMVCPMHGRRVRVDGETSHPAVRTEAGEFLLQPPSDEAAPPPPAAEVQRLRDELDALRQANAALEVQVSAVSVQMELMLAEMAGKSAALEKRSQEQARLTNFVERVMDTMDSLLLVLDRHGNVARANAEFQRSLGYAPEDLLGRSPDALLSPADLAALRAELPRGGFGTSVLFQYVLANGAQMEVHLAEKRDGQARPYLMRGAPLFEASGKLEGVVIVASDITGLRARELALVASEGRFRDYSEAASDYYWEMTAELRFAESAGVRFNHPVLRSAIGGTRRDIAAPEDLLDDAKWRRYEEDMAQHRLIRDFDYRIVMPDGERRWISVSGKPLFAEDGTFLGYRGVSADITERKRIEAELVRHRDHLAELVAEQTADLLAAKDEAEQANRMKSEFLSNISHELRTPLHGILAFAMLGLRRPDTAAAQKISDYFERIHQCGARLSGLVNDLLDLSKLEAGHAQAMLAPVDVQAVDETLRRTLEALMFSKRLTVRVEKHTDRVTVLADATRLGQVLQNVYSNAIKYSPPGGVLTLSYGDDCLVDDRRTRDALRISLRDQGVGIPEDELETVFDKFVQSSKTKTGAGGTGLGLAICREIMKAHGGTIRARNHPEGGAVFDIVVARA